MTEPDLVAHARAIIDANSYMILATADEQGRPWASPVYFATADYLDFYWMSAPETTHSQNLAARPELSIAIFDSTVAPGTGEAVYLSATAEQVPAGELDAALTIYPGAYDPDGMTRDRVEAPSPYRLFRATAREHSVLCPRDTGPCVPHGRAFDHRIQVPGVGRA